MAEFELIELIRDRCTHKRTDVRLGIGDDAALLAVPPGQLLAVSTDTLVEGVHFPRDTAAFDIGWKALAVNLSDLAAMGATPAWASLALTLPAGQGSWLAEFAEGFAKLAREFDVALVGGDTTQGPLSITVTVHGFVAEAAALRRDGARVGDGIFVTGTLGDAAAGLRRLDARGRREAETPTALPDDARDALVARLNRPSPRVAQGLVLRGRASACIDVSDGLVADLGHICAASRVGAALSADRLPASSALLALPDDSQRHALQLTGGDDYELCFTASSAVEPDLLLDLARSGCGATRIGTIVAGSCVVVNDDTGARIDVARAGWQHFA
jgi:thiamine-monophosphate kinase